MIFFIINNFSLFYMTIFSEVTVLLIEANKILAITAKFPRNHRIVSATALPPQCSSDNTVFSFIRYIPFFHLDHRNFYNLSANYLKYSNETWQDFSALNNFQSFSSIILLMFNSKWHIKNSIKIWRNRLQSYSCWKCCMPLLERNLVDWRILRRLKFRLVNFP